MQVPNLAISGAEARLVRSLTGGIPRVSLVRKSLAVFAMAVASAATSSVAAGGERALACGDSIVLPVPAAGERLGLVSAAPAPAWLNVEERGQDVEIDAQAVDLAETQIPPRLGRVMLRIEPGRPVAVRRTQPNAARGELRVTLDCAPVDDSARAWLLRATEPLRRARKALPAGSDPAPLLAEWEVLRREAPDNASRALALHTVAQVLFVNGRSVDAIDAFATAERAWSVAGDAERALAAHVGYLEAVYYAGRYAEILAAADYSGTATTPNYFRVRAHNTRCLALAALGNHAQARDCYHSSRSAYETLGEQFEVVNTMQAEATVERALGHEGAAEDMLRKALSLAVGPTAPVARGRIYLQLAVIAGGDGRLAESLRETNAALAEFSDDLKGENTARWQANTLIELAQSYAELGMLDEAYISITDAFAHLSARDARERVALALEVLADIDHRNHRESEALRWLDAARQLYVGLGQPERATRVGVAAAGMRLDAGDADAVGDVERLVATIPAANASVALDLLAADAAIRSGELRIAARRLDACANRRLAVSQRLQLAELRSRLAQREGDVARADRILREARDQVTALADSAGSATLRYLLLSIVRPLRAAAWAPLLDASDDSAAARVWEWLPAYAIAVTTTDGEAAQRAQAFDRALIPELVPSLALAAPAASRALVDALSAQPRENGFGRTAFARASLDEVRQSLPADTALMAWLDDGERGSVLWVTHKRAWLAPAAPSRKLHAAIDALRQTLRSAEMPVASIDVAAARVSAALWSSAAPDVPPARLVVIGDETLSTVPWALLRWPGHAEPLVDTTVVGVASLVRAVEDPAGVARLRAMVATPPVAAALPQLQFAQAEPVLIRASGALGASATTAAATRNEVFDALDDAGAIVHIATHGVASQGRLGYSGVWLDDGGDGHPDFLSWLDIMEHRVRARLVVLNACQLGEDSGAIANGSSSFAQALVLAGASQVVAAQWPVSDAATNLWVPAFYAALAADPRRDGWSALRSAQLRLRQSRAFRHPYYWASLAGFARFAASSNGGRPK